MDPGAAATIVAAGCLAGALNTVVGSGTLVTFPTLLALGHPPVVASVSSSIGLMPGSVAGAVGLRAELRGQEAPARFLGLAGGSGALLGAVILMHTSNRVFGLIVPALIVLACGLVLVQRPLTRLVATKLRDRKTRHVSTLSAGAVFCSGVYGGYFGAAQSIILFSVLGVLRPDRVVRTNALKNAITACVNLAAAVTFIVFASPSWEAVACLATGSVVGGALGAGVARRIPDLLLRGCIIAIGVGAVIHVLA